MLSFWIISIPLLFLVIAVLYKFVSADGDFTLMSKGHVKREEIEDKVIWITGASRGIGEILAKQLAGLGAKLILSARNESELERVKKQLSGKYAPHEVVILPLDLASGEDLLREAVEKAETCFDGAGVDYLIHNAAYERPKSSALEVSEQALKATFEVNTLGPISLTRMLSPYMVKRGRGHFVVMSSAAGKTPAPGQAVYSATKFALNGYFHTLRSELHHKGIKVTVVCPGPIKTPSTPEVPTSSQKGPFAERRVSCERCAELTIIAASHGLKEAWISYQPVLGVMYLVQYVPSVGFWLMDKMGSIPSEQSQDCGPRPTLMVISSSEAVIQAHRNIGVGATMNNQSAGGSGSTGTGGEGGPPASKPKQQRVRARRGQATEPQSIAERLCRERNAERMTALQELVPNANKLVSHNSFSIFFFFSIL